jgi:hypothetical protein
MTNVHHTTNACILQNHNLTHVTNHPVITISCDVTRSSLILTLSWRWRWYGPPRTWSTSIQVHSVTHQKGDGDTYVYAATGLHTHRVKMVLFVRQGCLEQIQLGRVCRLNGFVDSPRNYSKTIKLYGSWKFCAAPSLTEETLLHMTRNEITLSNAAIEWPSTALSLGSRSPHLTKIVSQTLTGADTFRFSRLQ